ncbi:hypothetical protein CONLIGDRAFT_650775 [Coniochaeta ligniaria NRRL 30616]|uniref:Uncharacterized protein n=1 Tax=Coniochaeta ligniaria NRRL 30616 TaxID=1408157 RepID=A0A1J7I3D2_9PEZI|nr:hypothetical protein CONLIGDRAFT_650775 [Coniochaeta ligniaria NRRL 30616]
MLDPLVKITESGNKVHQKGLEPSIRIYFPLLVIYNSTYSQEETITDKATGAVTLPEGDRSTSIPIGTIRLVPFPQPPYPKNGRQYIDGKILPQRPGQDRVTSLHDGKKPYIQLGRRAIIRPHRGKFLSDSDICKIILAIILPPLVVFLERSCGADLLMNILLTILGSAPAPTKYGGSAGLEQIFGRESVALGHAFPSELVKNNFSTATPESTVQTTEALMAYITR